jgi:hypothetical protein
LGIDGIELSRIVQGDGRDDTVAGNKDFSTHFVLPEEL